MARRPRLGFTVLTCSMLACGPSEDDAFSPFGGDGDGDQTGITVGDGDGDPTGDGDGDPTGDGDGDPTGDGDGDDGPKLDTLPPDTDTQPLEGCSSVDILFMIDDSPSMGPYQQALAGAFPGFIDTVFQVVPEGVSLHVGITTSNFSNGPCLGSSVCIIEGPSDDNYTPPGQGMVNDNGAQGRLFEYQGLRYFEANTADDPAELSAWFTGAASSVGESGCNKEKQTAGFAYATNPINDATNAGFIRDEGSVLLLFAISDEADSSPESLDAYEQMVTNAKLGCEDCVITAGLVNSCIEAEDNILWQFLNAFGEPATTGDFGDVGGYNAVIGSVLADAVADTCEQIDPVE